MQIVYFYQYFGTSKGGWSTRVHEMCKRWVAEGHQVTVVTTPYDKSDIERFKGITKQFNFDGINVIVLNFLQSNKHSKLKRIVRFIQYITMATYYVFKLKYDVAIASSGPITVGFLGLIAKKIRRKKFVFEVRDLWPAGSIELGIIKGNFLKNAAFWFEEKCYKNADLIVACSEGMKQDIEERFHYQHITVVPNACDTHLFFESKVRDIPAEFQGKRLILYTGSLGVMDHCMQIMWAAKKFDIKKYPDVQFVIIGDGVERQMMQQYAAEENLSHVSFLGLVPKTEVVEWLRKAYCAIVCFKDVPILNTVSPNKMFDAFASGLPIVQTTQGWIKQLLQGEQCGLTVPPDAPQEMANAIETYLDDPSLRQMHGENSHRISLTRFNRDKCAADMIAAIQAIFTPVPTKNIWIINQFAGHSTSGWGERHFYMSQYWKQMGYNVTIISGAFNHMFLNLPDAPNRYNFEKVDGVQFCWVNTPKYNPKSVKRFWSMIVFAWRVKNIDTKKISAPDNIVVSSMPIFPILSGYLLKKKCKARKLIFEIRDIWPLTLIELGETSKLHPITLFLSWFENFGYKKSDIIVTLLPYAAKHIVAHGGNENKIAYIPNGLDEKVLNSQTLDNSILNMLPKNKFIVGYTGTHNLGNALEFLAEAALKMVNNTEVFFVLVGDGYKKESLIAQVGDAPNILFIPKIPKQQIQALLTHFSVCFVGRNNSKLFDFGISGNKYFDYMMASKPILDSNNSPNGPAELAGCSLRVVAESSDAIVQGIISLKNMPASQRAEMGEKGKVYLEKNHSIKVLAEKYVTLFQ